MSTTRTTYSVKLKAALDELRPAFREVGQGLDQLARKRAEIAPVFLKTYQAWQRETGRPFIAFVHELDPAVPVNDRNAYRTHRSYRAAQYLRQLAENPEKTAPTGRTPLAMLAITIKSFLPLYGPSQKDQHAALEALIGATHWRERDRRRLLAKIRRAKAIGLPNVPRLVESAAVLAFEKKHVA